VKMRVLLLCALVACASARGITDDITDAASTVGDGVVNGADAVAESATEAVGAGDPPAAAKRAYVPGKISQISDPEVVPMEVNEKGDEVPTEDIKYTDWVSQTDAEVPGSDSATKPVESTTKVAAGSQDNTNGRGTTTTNAGQGPCCNICPQIRKCEPPQTCFQQCYQLCGPACQYTARDESNKCKLGKDCNMLPKQLVLDAAMSEEEMPKLRGNKGSYITFKPFASADPEVEEKADDASKGMETITQFNQI